MSQRSPWVVLGVLSLVGSLIVVPAGPAAGKDGEADNLATYSACVGPATDPAGFWDVPSRSVSEDAINCMAYYGIMQGSDRGMFEPRLGVTREQMALFLIRAAGPAGIELPDAEDQGYDDIGHLSRETRDAINQLVDLRITRGTTRSTFTPDEVVTRRQMAQFLARFLDLALVAEGGFDIDDVDPDDDHFTDLDDLPFDPYDAIRALSEMGITAGTTATTFSPDDPVTRAQMAMFISRALAHTNARPAGVTLQAEMTSVTAQDTVDIVVSVRDEDHLPVTDAWVDLFYAPVKDDAFLSTGSCSRHAVAETGDQRCRIDSSDETTNDDGNLVYTLVVDESLELWAWIGDLGDRFDADVTDHASLRFRASDAPTGLLVTDDMHEKARKLPFGRSVEYTFQLVDDNEEPVPQDDVEIRITSVERNDRRIVRDRTRTYQTDSDGRVQLRFRLSDPDRDSNDVDGSLQLTVVPLDDIEVIDETAVHITERTLFWSDDSSVGSALILEQSDVFHRASSSGGGVRNRVTATLVDQYGDPVRGVRVHFFSNDDEGLGHREGDATSAKNAYRKTTTSRGIATVTYVRDSDLPATETIDAFTEGKVDIDAESIKHYWVDETPVGETIEGIVAYHDKGNNTLVLTLADAGPYVIYYDPNDQFNVTKNVCRQELAQDGTCPGNDYERITETELYADFRSGIEEDDDLTVEVGDSRNRVNRFTRSE